MDELRGPTIQIVLRIKEGLGFGFLRSPFVVCGSLNGYSLETDSVVPSHAPTFDAELVWEADKRRFRNLRVQNVPIKIEVYTSGSHGRKNKVGYLMFSLLSAQPCPANKYTDIKNTWHRLLGVKSEGKCCQPQLMMALTVEDRISTPTPRNNLRMFHSNEVAYLSPRTEHNMPTIRSALLTYNDYIQEGKKTVSTLELEPKLLSEEGLIQIGNNCKHLFLLSFVIGSAENVDLLLEKENKSSKEADCFVTYSIFTHNIMTDRVRANIGESARCSAIFNQCTSLRLCTDLDNLSKYFAECPYVITEFCNGDEHVGVCSMDLRKLVPTNNIKDFPTFCNTKNGLTIHERCHILSSGEAIKADRRKPYIDVQMSLNYVGIKGSEKQAAMKPSYSATHLPTNCADGDRIPLDFRSGSCTQIGEDIGVAYTNTTRNTNRNKYSSGDAAQTSEIAELIKKMCETFAESQEKLINLKLRPLTSDIQVQCEQICTEMDKDNENTQKDEIVKDSNYKRKETLIKETQHTNNIKEKLKVALSEEDREILMRKYIEELEDWKERQQELYKYQLQMKEEYHLETLAKEWNKRRSELETKLSRGIEQCQVLSHNLKAATEDFKLREYRNTQRERKLQEAKKALEQHYTCKYQNLREISQKVEDDMGHRVRLKDMAIQELNTKIQQLEKHVDLLQENLRNCEKNAEKKYSGLSKDRTSSILQELRCLEEKLDNALQSKAFFKEQWSRAVRELHYCKLNQRKEILTHSLHGRTQLLNIGSNSDGDHNMGNNKGEDIFKTINDDNLTNLLKKPSIPSTNDQLNQLITQRDQLIAEDSPDEDKITQLNQEIRNILLDYNT